jgi:hypothetical protein
MIVDSSLGRSVHDPVRMHYIFPEILIPITGLTLSVGFLAEDIPDIGMTPLAGLDEGTVQR